VQLLLYRCCTAFQLWQGTRHELLELSCKGLQCGIGQPSSSFVPDHQPAAVIMASGTASLSCGVFMAGLISGKRILELGSGTGLVGLCAALLGSHVCMTDVPHVLEHAKTNLEHNKEAIASARGSISTAPLEWGSLQSSEQGREWLAANTRGWTSIDMLLGADLVYSEQQVGLTSVSRATSMCSDHWCLTSAYCRNG
jgi:hypothetical protein